MSFLSEGQEVERRFVIRLVQAYGGTWKPADKDTDIKKHIDVLWITPDKKVVSFDVKGLRKNNRADNTYDDTITWLEIRNVHGGPGWLYGEEDYIAFETNTEWIIVRPDRLINLLNSRVADGNISHTMPDEPYIYYQRAGRRDVIVKVRMEDVREVANKIIDKQV